MAMNQDTWVEMFQDIFLWMPVEHCVQAMNYWQTMDFEDPHEHLHLSIKIMYIWVKFKCARQIYFFGLKCRYLSSYCFVTGSELWYQKWCAFTLSWHLSNARWVHETPLQEQFEKLLWIKTIVWEGLWQRSWWLEWWQWHGRFYQWLVQRRWCRYKWKFS